MAEVVGWKSSVELVCSQSLVPPVYVRRKRGANELPNHDSLCVIFDRPSAICGENCGCLGFEGFALHGVNKEIGALLL